MLQYRWSVNMHIPLLNVQKSVAQTEVKFWSIQSFKKVTGWEAWTENMVRKVSVHILKDDIARGLPYMHTFFLFHRFSWHHCPGNRQHQDTALWYNVHFNVTTDIGSPLVKYVTMVNWHVIQLGWEMCTEHMLIFLFKHGQKLTCSLKLLFFSELYTRIFMVQTYVRNIYQQN